MSQFPLRKWVAVAGACRRLSVCSYMTGFPTCGLGDGACRHRGHRVVFIQTARPNTQRDLGRFVEAPSLVGVYRIFFPGVCVPRIWILTPAPWRECVQGAGAPSSNDAGWQL